MFCSYNFLNDVPNNNDIMHLANIMLNEAPNSNDAMHVANNNVHLTTMGVQQFSPVATYSHHAESRLTRDKR